MGRVCKSTNICGKHDNDVPTQCVCTNNAVRDEENNEKYKEESQLNHQILIKRLMCQEKQCGHVQC